MHMAYPLKETEGFPLDIEIINVIEDYVIFKGGLRLEIDTYLDLDEETDNGEEADVCVVDHPVYGWLWIDIEPIAPSIN